MWAGWSLVEGELDEAENRRSEGMLSSRKSEEKGTELPEGTNFDRKTDTSSSVTRGDEEQVGGVDVCVWGWEVGEFTSVGFYFLCKMWGNVDHVKGGEKFRQRFEESECMSLVIQDRGKTSLLVSHSRMDQLHGRLWNSLVIILKWNCQILYCIPSIGIHPSIVP